MAWYYDLVVLAILALCVWNGMRKGVSRSLLQTAATILSAVVALWVSQPLAELCYTEFLEKPVVSAVEGQLNTVDVTGLVQTALSDNGIPVSREQVQSMLADPEGTTAQYGLDSGWVNQQIDAAADSVEELTNGVLPSWLMKEIAGDGTVQKETAKSVISGDTHTAAQQLVSTYGKPILCSVLQAILFGVCFGVLMLLFQAVLFLIPVQQMGLSVDLVVGALAGLAKAGILLWMMVVLTKVVVSATEGTTPFFTEATIQKTYLFQLLYELKK